MSEQIVYVTARGNEPLATPTDIAKGLLEHSPYVTRVEQPHWHEEALTMQVTVDAKDKHSAIGIVEGALAQGTASVWTQFVVSGQPRANAPTQR